MQPSSPAPKICVRCGQDCADRPRVKDVRGRYLCKTCDLRGPNAALDPPAGDDLNPIDFEPSELPDSSHRPCMGCAIPLQPGAVICMACGTNQATGHPSGAPVTGEVRSGKPARACSKCGYDLAGLKTPKCPECGTLNLKRRRGLELDREAAEKAYKWEYIKPLAILGVCASIDAAILVTNYRGMELLGAALIVLARAPVGILAYFVCAFVWLGFEDTFRLTVFKLLGVFAAVSLATTLSLLIPFGFYRLSISFFVQVWMLADLMDMEYSDAAFVSAITSVAMIGAYFAVWYAFQ